MSTIIQIKRSANVAAPTTSDLVEGELAYSYDKSNSGAGAKLYIEALDSGNSPVVHAIGGKYYTDILDGATSSNTPGTIVTRDSSGSFSANIITANLYGNANTATRLATPRYINLSGNATGSASFDGSGNADIVVTTEVTPSSITTFTNKTYDVSVGSNNKFSIQGQNISSYSGSGEVVILQQSPTINVLNISDSQLNLDGGSGSFYWGGQSGVAQSGDLKAGIYASTPSSNNSLFTFGTNGANVMSVSVEGSLFIGTTKPSNDGGLNTSYPGWLVVQSGAKFGGDIDTLGGLNLTDPTSGKITFSDGTIQRTAWTSNHLTTANVVELNNLYFTNARARAALTSGNAILYNSTTGNITLSPSGVTANTYGGESTVPVFTVDEYGRVVSASNVALSSINFSTIAVPGQSSVVADSAGDTLTFANALGVVIATDASSDTLTLSLSNTGVAAATYGSATQIPSISVDAQGRITSAANVQISTDLGITGNVGSDTVSLISENLNIVGGTGITTVASSNTISIINTGVVSLSGTANEIEVSASNGSVQIGLPNDVTIGRNLSVTGNLIVLGNVTTISTSDLRVDDALIYLAGNNYSSDLVDIGFIGNYYDGSSQRHAGLFRDASDSGKFKLFANLQPEPSTGVIDTSNASFSVATLVANLTGGTVSGLTANINVSDGGTGRGTLTTNAVLYGLGTSAVGLATGTAGQVLQLDVSGVPVFGGLDGGSY